MKKLFALVMALVLCMTAASAMAAKTYKVPSDYATLPLALEKIASGDTIVLEKSMSGDGLMSIGKNFTLDLGGNTYSVTRKLVGSAGTESQAYHFEGGSNKITIKNGTLTSTMASKGNGKNGARLLLHNYADLTLENVTLDGSDMNMENGYAVAYFSNGSAELKGETNIISAGKHSALLLNQDTGSYKPDLKIDTTGLIKGDIDMINSDSDNLKIESGAFTDFGAQYYTDLNGKAAIEVYGKNKDPLNDEPSEFVLGDAEDISDMLAKLDLASGEKIVLYGDPSQKLELKNVPSGVNIYVFLDDDVVINGQQVPASQFNGNQMPEPYVVPAKPTNLPQTGDNSSLMLWVSVMAMAVVGFVASKKVRFN